MQPDDRYPTGPISNTYGPFETSEQAAAAAAALVQSSRELLLADDLTRNLRVEAIEQACAAAGVELGAYDRQTVGLYLAGEPPPPRFQSLLGIIVRAGRRDAGEFYFVIADAKRRGEFYFVIADAKRRGEGEVIRWWAAENAGYETVRRRAGRYSVDALREGGWRYYKKVDCLCVPAYIAERLKTNRKGEVPSSTQNWNKLELAALDILNNKGGGL